MMEDITDIAVGIGQPVAQNLGMIGLIVVLLIGALVVGLMFIIKYLLDNHKDERREWRESNEKREEKVLQSYDKNSQAMENLTEAIRLSSRIGNDNNRVQ